MPRVGFQPTITASERAKTVHALDRSATVTGADVHDTRQLYTYILRYLDRHMYLTSSHFGLNGTKF
jgi:hypothetical protein